MSKCQHMVRGLRVGFWALACIAGSAAVAAEIPVDVGVGPARFLIPEKLQAEDEPIWGMHIDMAAVIDKKTIERNKGHIPPEYQKAAEKVDEARIGYLLIPDSLILSPPHRGGGLSMYGATWRPLALGLPVVMGPVRLSLDSGLMLTYAHIDTGDYKIVDQDADPIKGTAATYVNQVTNFFRPGGDIRAECEFKFSDSALASLGWSSAYYVPQKIGGNFGEVGSHLDRSLWRINQAFLMFHYRVPVHVNI